MKDQIYTLKLTYNDLKLIGDALFSIRYNPDKTPKVIAEPWIKESLENIEEQMTLAIESPQGGALSVDETEVIEELMDRTMQGYK